MICYNQVRADKQLHKECEICGNSYKITACRKETSKYCSNQCKNEGLKQYKGENHPSWSGGRQSAYYRYQYGIDEQTYDFLLKFQNFGCAICSSTNPGGRGNRFHVDHDHETDIVRGLLCNKCNLALGLLQDSIYLLDNAINYLENTSMANMKNPAYQGKALGPTPTSQQSQGRETGRRTGSNDPSLLRSNEPAIAEDRKLGSGNSARLGGGKTNVR